MTITVSASLLSAANAAASAAADGSKNAAFCVALSSGIGASYRLVARRDSVVVLDLTMSGSLTASASGLQLPSSYATLNTLDAADIDTGTWTLRVEKGSDSTVYLSGSLGRSGADWTLSDDLDPERGIALSGMFMQAPAIDSVSPGSSLTLDLMKGDVNTSLTHEMLMNGVNPSWDWGTKGRAGVGPNPPQASGWGSPAWILWGHAGTERGVAPGNANWRLAIHEMHTYERRSGTWQAVHSPVTTTEQHSGAMYLNYETNQNTSADRRTSNGYVEVKFPSAGGAYHWYPTFRTAVPTSGAQHRVVLIKASLTKDNPSGTDDRASARVALLAGGDYWRSMSVQWGDGYSNDDFWIGRARKPALYPDKSWHVAHTMTNDSDINGFLSWAATQGIS